MDTTESNSDQLTAIGSENDFAVIQQVLAGNQPKFELLMRRYNNRLYRIAKSILKDQDDAIDVVQESWVNTYHSLEDFKGPDGFDSWVSRIALNNALIRLRKSARVEYQTENELERLINLTDSEQSPPDRLSQFQLSSMLEVAIDSLPIKYRSVFVLRAVQQLDTRETAESLDLEVDIVKKRFSRAKKMLQPKLLTQFEMSGSTLWEFAGERCNRIVNAVFVEIAIRP